MQGDVRNILQQSFTNLWSFRQKTSNQIHQNIAQHSLFINPNSRNSTNSQLKHGCSALMNPSDRNRAKKTKTKQQNAAKESSQNFI